VETVPRPLPMALLPEARGLKDPFE
jgi:hypothetical protein